MDFRENYKILRKRKYSLKNSILIIGISYKKNVDDIRLSPQLT